MSSNLEPIPWGQVGKQRPSEMKSAGMVIDLRRCIGCHSCSISCKTEHNVPLGSFRTRVHYAPQPDSPQLAFVPMLCMQCKDAPCMPACPTSAFSRLEDGRVVVEEEACNGTKACVAACPYDAIAIHPQTNKAMKCDFCEHRAAVGMEPACVESCPTTALRFGDLGDQTDPVTQYAKEHNAKAYKADAGTDPSVLYIGHEEWMESVARGVQISDDEAGIVYE